MSEKKGQATILIVLGIVIVAVLVVIFSFRSYIFRYDVDQQENEQILNEAIKPVKSYLDSCLNDLTQDGILKMSLQAGYIKVLLNDEPINPMLPFSRNLDVFGNGALKVPYWFYETNNGIKRTEIPKLKEMEIELGEYLNDNINSCLANTTFFQDYEISNFKNTKTDVMIGDNSVIVKIKTSFDISYKGLDQRIESINLAIDSNLGRMYKIAKNTFDAENRNLFFEDKTFDIMSLYKDEIPIYGLEFSCSAKTWNYQDIYRDFRKIMAANIPQFKVDGTKYDQSDKFYLWKNVMTNIKSDDVSINFLYSENFPTYLDVNPKEGNILRTSNTAGGNRNPFLSLLCLQYYNYVYSVRYPVLISVSDDSGNTFQYAMQVILKNNQPRENIIITDYPEIGLNDRFCNNRINEISVSVLDEMNKPIDGAGVSYQCSGFVCDIGKTENGVLKEKFPNCFNGFVLANKEEYYTGKAEFSTDNPGEISVNLKKIYNKPIKVLNNGLELGSEEEALISFNILDGEFSSSINYPDIKNADLIEGDYDVSVTISKKGNFVIKGEKKKQCVKIPRGSILSFMGFKKEECADVQLDDLNLDSVVIGRSKFTMFATQFDLQDKTELVIDTSTLGVPNSYDSMERTFSNLTFGTYDFQR